MKLIEQLLLSPIKILSAVEILKIARTVGDLSKNGICDDTDRNIKDKTDFYNRALTKDSSWGQIELRLV
jgi:hypothetical protein